MRLKQKFLEFRFIPRRTHLLQMNRQCDAHEVQKRLTGSDTNRVECAKRFRRETTYGQV